MANVLDKIHKSAIKFLLPLNPEETFKTIVDEANKLVGTDSGSIFLDQQGQFKRVYASLPGLYNVIPRRKGYIYTVFKTRKPVILQSKDVQKIHPDIAKLKFKSVIIVPLSNRNKSIGALTLQSDKENYFNQEKLSILKLFSSLATLAIRKTELYDETKKTLETRDLFISMASHELRTPITTISGYIQLLRSKTPSDNSTQSRWLDELNWESKRLTLLVNELLQSQRLKSGQLEFNWKECDLKMIVRRIENLFKITHQNRTLIIEDQAINGDSKVVGDYDKLLQVITNLLDNAVKFSPTKSPIILRIKSHSDTIILEVQDKGKGISRAEKKQIFEKYYRGEHHIEGMGLGLNLVKYIIASHHGSINVHSRLNKGTTMEVKLPLAKI